MTKTCIAMMAACLVCPPAFAQHETHGTGALSAEQVGTVDFQTSCTPAVKTDMNRAVACCIPSGSRKPARTSRPSPPRTRTVRWRTGAWR